MEKLSQLIALCKGSVTLTVNDHKDNYQTVEEFISHQFEVSTLQEDEMPLDVYREMIKRDTVIHLQFYPDTPIGFYEVYGYDLDMVLDHALAILVEGSSRANILP